MRITEQNTETMSDRDLARYREELLSQLNDTVEHLHRANLEANSRSGECIHATMRDIRDAVVRNGINI